MKKGIGISIGALLVGLLLIGYIFSYAGRETIYVNLSKTNTRGIGYGIGNPQNGGKPIWALRTYTSNDKTELLNPQRNIYCAKAEYGETWNSSNTDAIVEYNLSYDMQDEREKLIKQLDNGAQNANSVVKALLDTNKGGYQQLLWLLDNMYVAGETDKDTFLDKIGIKKDEYGYYDEDTNAGYDYIMTDDDIKAVQASAIWHVTNYVLDGNEQYNQESKSDWITITTNGSTYQNLSELTKSDWTEEGEQR